MSIQIISEVLDGLGIDDHYISLILTTALSKSLIHLVILLYLLGGGLVVSDHELHFRVKLLLLVVCCQTEELLGFCQQVLVIEERTKVVLLELKELVLELRGVFTVLL